MGRERFAMGWRLGLLLLLSGAALLTAVEVVELHDTSLPDVSVSGPLANDELALIQSEDSSTPDERQRAINKIHAILDGKTPNPTHLEPHKDGPSAESGRGEGSGGTGKQSTGKQSTGKQTTGKHAETSDAQAPASSVKLDRQQRARVRKDQLQKAHEEASKSKSDRASAKMTEIKKNSKHVKGNLMTAVSKAKHQASHEKEVSHALIKKVHDKEHDLKKAKEDAKREAEKAKGGKAAALKTLKAQKHHEKEMVEAVKNGDHKKIAALRAKAEALKKHEKDMIQALKNGDHKKIAELKAKVAKIHELAAISHDDADKAKAAGSDAANKATSAGEHSTAKAKADAAAHEKLTKKLKEEPKRIRKNILMKQARAEQAA